MLHCFVRVGCASRQRRLWGCCSSLLLLTHRPPVLSSSSSLIINMNRRPAATKARRSKGPRMTGMTVGRLGGGRMDLPTIMGEDEAAKVVKTKKDDGPNNAEEHMAVVGPSLLSRAWAPLIRQEFHDAASLSDIAAALRRTIPLLVDADPSASSSFMGIVPFLCRYRQDTIQPLSNAAVRELASWVQGHYHLDSLRRKILAVLPAKEKATIFRVQTSRSRSELNDLYAPYKPESKGSLEKRLQKEQPQLVAAIDLFWESPVRPPPGRFHASDANTITLLANRIAKHMECIDACQDYCDRFGRIEVKKAATSSSAANSNDNDEETKTTKAKKKKRALLVDQDDKNDEKFMTYHDFECPVQRLRDHQILAIRRGVDQKRLSMKFVLDNDRAEKAIRSVLSDRIGSPNVKVWLDAIHDAYTRLLRKRCTNRLWKVMCDRASDRGMRVFCDNVRSALLAPPLHPNAAVLSLDPGYKAGIKVAMIDGNGELLSSTAKSPADALRTIQFIDDWEKGRAELVDAMRYFDTVVPSQQQPWIVALGNGHGTHEAQRLAKEALEEIKKPSVEIRLVDEAGASVWSVTAAAAKEYPAQPASALAAISIGRRLLNPLDELVKIPPKSLGLGMYQHDHSEKALEERLDAASIDAVAEVGVDGNSCSLDILEKVPGLTRRLAERIVQKRPLCQRDDLLAVSGIGPAIFQSCAAFIRVNGGSEPLDGTLCHPESYDVAKWALKTLKWKLSDPLSVAAVPSDAAKRRVEWKSILVAAAAKFHIPEERVYSILVQLVHSIEKKDARLVSHESTSSSSTTAGSVAMLDQPEEEQGSPLPPNLSSLDKLKKACPVRSIKGTIRNVVDFGAFIDIGAESDGLLHCSKLGPALKLSAFQIGQSLSVDVLSVENQRISLAIPVVASRLSQNDPVPWNGAKRRRNDDAESSAPPKKQKQSRAK